MLFNPPLNRAKNHINKFVPTTWRYALFGLFLIYDKYYRLYHDQWFLMQCRKEHLTPSFIERSSYTKHMVRQNNSNLSKLIRNFHHKLLNDTIKDNFIKPLGYRVGGHIFQVCWYCRWYSLCSVSGRSGVLCMGLLY